MNNMILKSNQNLTIGNKPMVLLPLDIYEKITKSLETLNLKTFHINIKKNSIALASESSLSKDWLNKEEEKVWQNL